jgi:hypothetical protein
MTTETPPDGDNEPPPRTEPSDHPLQPAVAENDQPEDRQPSQGNEPLTGDSETGAGWGFLASVCSLVAAAVVRIAARATSRSPTPRIDTRRSEHA